MGTQHTGHKTKRERVFLPGGIPLYKPYRVCAAPKGRFSCRFCLNTGMESGMVFEGTIGVYELIYRFSSKRVRKKEKYVNSKWIFRTFFGCCSNLSNDDIIS